MKTRSLMTICAAALLAFISIAAVGQDQNRGQSKKQYRQFNQKQQQTARTYYDKNKDQPVFKQPDQWNDDYESRIQPGYVLDDDMRQMSRPVPDDMIRGLGPAPQGYSYIVIGGHVILVDSGYRVHDAIHLHISL